MRQSIRLGTFFGIAVGVNWSVFLILALFAWNLADYVLPPQGGTPDTVDWIAGVIGAVVLLASLLAHEVSHSLVARRNGVGVRSITLFLFGGVAQLEGEARTPGADFRIAAVGPATSLMLAAFFAAVEVVLVDTLSWLWEINVALAIFNLIPAAPLDGGRILRAGLWRRWGSHSRASIAAARTGRGFAVLLIAVGVFAFVEVGITGLWSALIGLFLYSSARAEERYAVLHGALSDLKVGQVMTPHPPTVPQGITVDELVNRHLGQYQGHAIAVTDDNGWLAGVVTAQAVHAVPPERRSTTTLAQIAIPLSGVLTASPDESMDMLLGRMTSSGGRPALVLDADNRLAGVVTAADLQRAGVWSRHR
ncbi:MAG: site-2 protease family protein [Acidimicrobiales bacterium]